MRLPLHQAILATVHYFDIVDFSPTLEEISRYLFGATASPDTVESTIPLVEGVVRIGGFYCLEGRENLVERRVTSIQMSRILWRKVEAARKLFESCPFVKMVAVCNTLAYGNVTAKSDIDLLIMTSKRTLWQTRLLLKILTHLKGIRVHHEFRAGRFCLSFMISVDAPSFEMVRLPFDPHLAYFVRTAVPIVGHELFYQWQKDNAGWTRDYLPTYLDVPLSINRSHRSIRKMVIESLLTPFKFPLEKVAQQIQRKKDTERLNGLQDTSGVVMTSQIFKFHEQDARQEIADRFAERLRVIVTSHRPQSQFA